MRAGLASAIVGVPGGALLGWLGWVGWIPALVLGFAVGSAGFVASGRHRDASVQGLAGAAAALGMIVAAVVVSVARAGGASELGRALLTISYAEFAPAVVLALAGAIVRFLL